MSESTSSGKNLGAVPGEPTLGGVNPRRDSSRSAESAARKAARDPDSPGATEPKAGADRCREPPAADADAPATGARTSEPPPAAPDAGEWRQRELTHELADEGDYTEAESLLPDDGETQGFEAYVLDDPHERALSSSLPSTGNYEPTATDEGTIPSLRDDDDVDDAILPVSSRGVRFSLVDFDQFAFDAHDFDEAPTREELSEPVRTDERLSREQRARQEATKLGREFDWDEHGIDLLTEVFVAHWWSAAKRAMRRELAAGLTPDELRIAIELRRIWREHPEFFIDLTRLGEGSGGHLGVAKPTYRTLSWPAALRLVRLFSGLPDPEELELLLEHLYDRWYGDTRLRGHYGAFHHFLYAWLEPLDETTPAMLPWSFDPDPGLEPETEPALGFDADGASRRWLSEHGLLPDVWTSRFDYRVPADILAANEATAPRGPPSSRGRRRR